MLLKLIVLFVIVDLIATYDPKLDEELSENYILAKLAEIRKMEEIYLAALKDQKKIIKEMKHEKNIWDKQEL